MNRDQLMNSSLELKDNVLIHSQASAEYSFSSISEFMIIPLSLYLERKSDLFPKGLYYHGLDGKHSETKADISFHESPDVIFVQSEISCSRGDAEILIDNAACDLKMSFSDLMDYKNLFIEQFRKPTSNLSFDDQKLLNEISALNQDLIHELLNNQKVIDVIKSQRFSFS